MEFDIGRITVFQGLEVPIRRRIQQLATIEKVEAGAAIFELGAEAIKLYAVVSGNVSLTMPVEIRGMQQDAFVEEILVDGMFGWSSLVRPHRYTMAARAAQDSELVSWRGSEVRELLHREPASASLAWENLLILICHRLHRMQAMWIRELQRTVRATLT